VRRSDINGARRRRPAAFITFDLLREGDDDVRRLPLRERRARLERVVRRIRSPVVRLGEWSVGDGRVLWERAIRDRAVGRAA
jgi:ATP-dependent DNA ligase